MPIRAYRESDLTQVVALFQRAVAAIDPDIYSPAQKALWSPDTPDLARWQARLSKQSVYVEATEDRLMGFISLEADGHIDFTYVDPAYQRQGIAQQLYDFVENLARNSHAPRLYVEASILARPFFEKQGFTLVSANQNQRGDQILINYTLEKHLYY